jgi:hypothetical protein
MGVLHSGVSPLMFVHRKHRADRVLLHDVLIILILGHVYLMSVQIEQ